MARKIQVIDDRDRATGETLRKSVAQLMVRRLLADWIVPNVSIRRRKILEIKLEALPREARAYRPYIPADYQHHIEPKIVGFDAANSEWQRYLEGWNFEPISA